MNLSDSLKIFSSFDGMASPFGKACMVGPYILYLKTKSVEKSPVTLGYLALVHGNELLGLPIINSLIESILNGSLKCASDIYFGLGNIPAAFADKRFIEEDMNRCFGRSDDKTPEAKRARELESLMLNQCDFLVDIHQTIFSSQDPFFIFQYTNQRCLAVMEKWNPGIPVILQNDPLGENTGLCADEYMKSLGRFGAALELGQLGTNDHFDLGFGICKRVLEFTNQDLSHVTSCSDTFKFPLLRLYGSFKVKDSSYKLDAGWKNLSPFKEGQRLGSCDAGEVLAPTDGYMLFPRYRLVNEGQELFYYCTNWDSEKLLKAKSHLKAKEQASHVHLV